MDVLQDIVAHKFAHIAERRHATPCLFRKVFPGWTRDPKNGLLLAFKTAGCTMWVPTWVSQFAFVFRARNII